MVEVRTISQNEIPHNAEIKNDMIEEIKISRDRGFLLGVTLYLKSGRQPFLSGYNNTNNVGFILLALAELLGVNTSGDSTDFIGAFRNTPCRIAQNGHGGDEIAKVTWLGHFMSDKWMLAYDIVQTGMKD